MCFLENSSYNAVKLACILPIAHVNIVANSSELASSCSTSYEIEVQTTVRSTCVAS